MPAPKKLVQVSLPPAAASYVVGERLFPANYISGYDADLGEWTAAGWNAHVLAMCQANAACTSTAAYSSTLCCVPLLSLFFWVRRWWGTRWLTEIRI